MKSFRLYLDDSGTNSQTERIFLAGVMLSVDDWAGLDELWNKTIKNHGLDFFHAADNWSTRSESVKMFRFLAEIIYARNFAVWWGSVNKKDFDKVKPEYPKLKLNMFELLVFGSIGGSSRAMNFLGNNGKLGVIIESGHPPIRQWARSKIAEFEKKSGIFEQPFKVLSKGPVPLQVADYVAWDYNRFVETQGKSLPFFKLVNSGNSQRFFGAEFDEKLLRKTFDKLVSLDPLT